jgi:hypothetical protein
VLTVNNAKCQWRRGSSFFNLIPSLDRKFLHTLQL